MSSWQNLKCMFSKNYIIKDIAEMLQVEKIFDFVWNFKNVNN